MARVEQDEGHKCTLRLDGNSEMGLLHNLKKAGQTLVQKGDYTAEKDLIYPRPICFAVPEENIVEKIPDKVWSLAHNIPGIKETYIYTDEKEYYQGYGQSYFAITKRKQGWDCLRHYEILASGCIPYFLGLENCPPPTLHNFPKQLVSTARQIPGVPNIEEDKDLRNLRFDIDFSRFDLPRYYALLEELLEYTRKYLTTKALASYVLEQCGLPLSGAYLVLRACHPKGKFKVDYQRDLLIHGLHAVGATVYTYPEFSYLYDTFPKEELEKIYGKGFSYARRIRYPSYSMSLDAIKAKIKQKLFAGIIYTTQSNLPIDFDTTPFFRLIGRLYSEAQIVFVDGRDKDHIDYCDCIKAWNCFKREIPNNSVRLRK
jgi:hypothetical protein